MTGSKTGRTKTLLAVVAAGVFGVVGCGSGDGDGDRTGETTTSTVAEIDEPVTTGEADTATDDTVSDDTVSNDNVSNDNVSGDTVSDDSAGADPASFGLSARQTDDAIDIARAYFVAVTDYTGDQFDWTLVAAAQDDDGQWWARVSAMAKEGTSLEVEQIFVYSPAGTDSWFALDMGTGIDPAIDERFPEEVRDSL